jgi:alkylmercury lyase
MTATSTAGTPSGSGLDRAWIDTFTRHHELISLLLVLIRLTDAGAHTVPVEKVAKALGHSVGETRAMFARVSAGLAWAEAELEHGRAGFRFTGDTARPRFRYRIGERTVAANGCAPDSFLIAYALRKPFTVESVCPATGTHIEVEFGPDGVIAATPNTTVVAAIDPVTVPQAFTLTDPGLIDTDICLHQPFFASADAAQAWLAAHPSGQAVPVAEFYHRWRSFIAQTPAGRSLHPTPQSASTIAAHRATPRRPTDAAAMNLFTGTENARQWLAAHPRIAGTVQTKEEALSLGIDIFGKVDV